MPHQEMRANYGMKPLEKWWPGFPMLRIWVVLTIGILCYSGRHDLLAVLMLTVSAGMSIRSALPGFSPSARLRPVLALAPLLLMASIGYILVMYHDIRKDPDWVGHPHQKHRYFLAEIVSEPATGRGKTRCMAEFRYAFREGIWHRTTGKIWVQLPPGEYAKGQYILSSAIPQPLSLQSARTNSFYQHLLNKQVMHLLSASGTDTRILQDPRGNRLSVFGQRYLKNVLTTYIKDEASRNMAGAILYGERSALPKQLTQAYIQTGVIHVIAISGMHLAIIYSLISFMLKPLQKSKLKWLYCFLSITMLWMYTWICGGSPSVQRSAWMFSFLLAGETLARNNRAGNSLAASAVVMLCNDPYLLWDIGFQLSYAAVASLLIYQKSISRLINPENLLLKHGWNVISTTISAQILTTPLVAFHFGTFPTIFLLSNILAVPLSGIILLLLCGAALAYPLGLGWLPASLAEALIQFMNTRIALLSQLRFASITNIKLDIWDMINIYLILLSFTIWIRLKKR